MHRAIRWLAAAGTVGVAIVLIAGTLDTSGARPGAAVSPSDCGAATVAQPPAPAGQASAGGISANLTKITPPLSAQLQQAGAAEHISCLVTMADELPYDSVGAQSNAERIATLHAAAQASQQAVQADLGQWGNAAEVRESYWVFNGFHLVATPEVIRWLSTRPDVRSIGADGVVHLIEPALSTGGEVHIDANQWNIIKVAAPTCWAAGYNGQGSIIAQTDTGVDTTHPALAGRYGGAWFDAINGRTNPYDDNGHGTHTMGTIMGLNGYGVAPGAQFVAAKVLNSGGSGSFVQCLNGLQWVANEKASVNIRAMSASWGVNTSVDTYFWNVCLTLKTVGILPVFANGNNGPGTGSVGTPGDFPTVLGVGATDSADNIASFSSRGPAPNVYPWNSSSFWYRPDWNLNKPDLSAPGVHVLSTWPGGSYQYLDGTSMATPHIAGAVAILCQKDPSADPNMLYNALLNWADHPSQGGSFPNNNYGWGRLNIWNSISHIASAPTPPQPDPMTFDVAPHQVSAAGIAMRATLATAQVPPVQYFFHFMSGGTGGADSGWQAGQDYENDGLSPNTSYTFQVKARDGSSPPVENQYSTAASAYTAANVPGTPAVAVSAGRSLSIGLDAGGNPANTEFAIQCTSTTDPAWNGQYVGAGGIPSATAVWQNAGAWGSVVVSGLVGHTQYCFAVKARNGDQVETAFSTGACATTLRLGDMNCDGAVNFTDINPFVLALSDPAGYAAAYPGCNILGGDINDDGSVNFTDINPFVALLAGPP